MWKKNIMSATAPTLTPKSSPLGTKRWIHFVEDVELSCYSYHLPHVPHDHDESIPSSSSSSSFSASPAALSSSRLDDWYRALHPSAYVDEPRGSAWTDASHGGRTLLRKTAWSVLGDGDDASSCSCEYGYSDTWQGLVTSSRMMRVLREMTDEITRIVGRGGGGNLNSVNLNYYPPGGGVGYHADDEFLFDGTNRPTRIISLSLCGPRGRRDGEDEDEDEDEGGQYSGERVFQVKRKSTRTDGHRPADRDGGEGGDDIVEITLRHGDVITMEGMFQRHYLHSIWPGDDDDPSRVDDVRCRGERINLTWRTIVRHLDGSDECRGLVCPLATRE